MEKRFPDSRRKAYYLMAIHENLTKVPKQQLREVGWSKAIELVKVARGEGEEFDCATWLHKAKELPKEGFKGEVERDLTSKEAEPWELLYFRVFKGQLAVIERALETVGLMLGTDKSRGYCLEMICADLLAGANMEEANPVTLLDPAAYKALCKQVLRRDNWRCQNCSATENLQVHHIQWRSKLGNDSLENWITLCADYHRKCHGSSR